MSAVLGSAISAANTVLSYFRPSKSPYYSVIVSGIIALIATCSGITERSWLKVSIPIFIVLIISLWLSFKQQPHFSEEEHEEQIKFARGFSLSSALLSLAFTARMVDDKHSDSLPFYLNYAPCIIQIVIFLLYSYARSYKEDSQSSYNLVQLALITTAFLGGGSYSIVKYANLEKSNSERWNYLIAAIGLYFLWLCCIPFWLSHLRKLIKVTIPRDL